jgi:hypothetical protein
MAEGKGVRVAVRCDEGDEVYYLNGNASECFHSGDAGRHDKLRADELIHFYTQEEPVWQAWVMEEEE